MSREGTLTTTNVTRASCPTSVDALVFVVTNVPDGTMLILSIYPPGANNTRGLLDKNAGRMNN